ncbi:MAG: hypothetical protein ACE10D_11510 [Planctomycetota bacterium]
MIPWFARIHRAAQNARQIWRDRRMRHKYHVEPPAGPKLIPGLSTRFRRLRPTTWQDYLG